MARIRSIKPDFFLHDGLAELPALHRLLFIGLWTLADKEGRLADNPKRIKAVLFPWEDCDMGRLLADLDDAGFIHRYEAASVNCIAIPGFKKHQRPHPKEPDTGLPAPPPRVSREKKRQEINDATAFPSSPARKGREGKELLVSGNGEREPEKETSPPPEQQPVPVRQHLPLTATRPEKDPAVWTGDDFWQWAQFKRQEVGLVPEGRRPRELGSWYSAALMTLHGAVERLQEAFYRFGEDEHWQAKTPPLPFAGFMSQWDRFVPKGVALAGSG